MRQPPGIPWAAVVVYPCDYDDVARTPQRLCLELTISYTPAGDKPKHLTKRGLEDAEAYEHHGATVRFAASS